MLSSFFIRNFRSILELRLDFSYGEGKAPNGYRDQEILPFLEPSDKQRIVPCAAFFGANASGKTNLLKAFSILKNLIVTGVSLPDFFEPNLLNRKFSTTTFEPEFVIGGDRFNYRITYSGASIEEETFLKNGKVLFSVCKLKAEFSQHFSSSTYTEEKLTDILHVECTNGEGLQTKLFLHRIGLSYSGLNHDTKLVFEYFKQGINYWGNDRPILISDAVDILAAVMDGDKSSALHEITNVVRQLDIDIMKIDIIQREVEENEVMRPGDLMRINAQTGVRHSLNINTTHEDVSGNQVLLSFMKHESDGTKRLAGLVGLILYTLKVGGVLLIDELDHSLHSLLMREIVLFFKKRRLNQNQAQLIFTTHNTDILDDSILRISEIYLVRKTIANGTLVRRLVDARKDGEDIRNVTNFRKQYLAGFYAGVPHPAL